MLAGEIQKPGAFSLITLRFLAEADQEIAAAFDHAARFRIDGECILQPDRKAYQGEMLERLRLLEQAGLLDPVSPNDGMEKTHPSLPGELGGFVAIVEGDLYLRIHTSENVRYRIIHLTRLGIEIATLLPPVDPLAVLRNLAQTLPQELASMDICRMEPDQTGFRILQPPIKVVRPVKDTPPREPRG